MTKVELAFCESLSTQVDSGLTYDRAMELLCEVWAKDKPTEARIPGRRACDSSTEDALEVMVEPHVDDKGQPGVKISSGNDVVIMPISRANGLAMEIMSNSEAAESESYIRRFFAGAHDQVLAKKIVDKLVPAMAKYRRQSVENWAKGLLSHINSNFGEKKDAPPNGSVG